MKYPKSIFFIITGVLCEKFTYFGIKTILPLYLVDILRYSKNTAVMIFHAHGVVVYIFSLIGAIIADCWLGRFDTILYSSIIYAIGALLLTSSSVPSFNLPIGELTILGLLMTALPGGLIKPCITSFGGDQFKLPQQEAFLNCFFSLYYYVLNISSLLANLIVPILRNEMTCFGSNTCYPMAFGVPTVLLIVFLVIFFSAKNLYQIKKPEGNIAVKVISCICHAIWQKKSSHRKRDHWLDYADDKYDLGLIEDTKSVLRLLKIFLPVPIFWALFQQEGSLWIFQATRMDGEMFGYMVKPDQFQLIHPISFAVLLPIFQYAIYPIIAKFLFINTPLRKMTVGGLLTFFAFVLSGIVELNLETYTTKPSSGLAQIRIFNTLNCNATTYLNDRQYDLEALDVYQNLSVPVNNVMKFYLRSQFVNCSFTDTPNLTIERLLEVKEAKATSWLLSNHGISLGYEDSIEKSKSGDPKLRAFIYAKTNASVLRLESVKTSYTIDTSKVTNFTEFIKVNHNHYNLSINNVTVIRNFPIKFGGVYTIVGYISENQRFAKVTTLVEPNSMHMLWLLPQYLLLSVADIMFSVTSLEFAYSQAPASMKSLLQAVWFLCISFGDIIIIVITKMEIFDRQAHEVFFYAALMLVNMLIFIIIAKSYKYVDNRENTNDTNDIKLQSRKLLSNSQKS